MIKNPGSPSGKAWMGVACWLSAGNWQKCLGHMQAFGPLSEDRVLQLPGWIMWGSWNTLTCKEKDSVFKAAVKDKMTQSLICYSWTVHLLYFMLFIKDRGDSWKGKHTASISIRDLLMPSAKFKVDGNRMNWLSGAVSMLQLAFQSMMGFKHIRNPRSVLCLYIRCQVKTMLLCRGDI